MPKIQIDVESYANNSIDEEVTSAVNNATPANIVPQAEVIRDANGKVVKVFVNLPAEISASDLETAKNAVENNNGVSKAKAFPVGGVTENFDDLTPGDTIVASGQTAQFTIDDIGARLRAYSGSTIEAALAADSVGGTGSAHQMVYASYLSQTMASQAQYQVHAFDQNLSSLGAFTFKCKVKKKNGAHTGDDYTGARMRTTLGATLELDASSLRAGGNWQVYKNGSWTDTGIAQTDFIEVEITLGLDGVLRLKAGGQEVNHNLGFVPNYSNFLINVDTFDGFSTAPASSDVSSLIIDDMSFEIISGT